MREVLDVSAVGQTCAETVVCRRVTNKGVEVSDFEVTEDLDSEGLTVLIVVRKVGESDWRLRVLLIWISNLRLTFWPDFLYNIGQQMLKPLIFDRDLDGPLMLSLLDERD